MLILSPERIDAPERLKTFEAETIGAGAVVSFSGRVRGMANNGAVKSLMLQAYSPMTENGIAATIRAAEARWSLQKTLVIHRTGKMHPGETIVFVAAASKHRRDAFEAADFLMDYLKTEAIFWKQESTESGAEWIEPRAKDYADAARWDT